MAALPEFACENGETETARLDTNVSSKLSGILTSNTLDCHLLEDLAGKPD